MRIKQLKCGMYVIVDKYGKQISGLMSKFTAKHTMAKMAQGSKIKP